MDRILSTVGFCLFAAVSFAHFVCYYRIGVLLVPQLIVVVAPCLIAIWLGTLWMLLQALVRNRLQRPFGIVFAYVMLVMLAGMRLLAGVPALVGNKNWRDPNNLLTPKAEYILHNHGAVTKVISRDEYNLFSLYGACYFTAGGMLLTAALCLLPVDHDNQLGTRKGPRFGSSRMSW